jgi:hypothetical protein
LFFFLFFFAGEMSHRRHFNSSFAHLPTVGRSRSRVATRWSKDVGADENTL